MDRLIGRLPNWLSAILIFSVSFNLHAVTINWIDWQSSSNANGFTAQGVITSGSETINVTYNNPQGVSFFQDGVGNETDWWESPPLGGGAKDRTPGDSPYTSTGPTGVDNIPTGTDMIGLRYAGSQTLTFDTTVANLVFSYISLNSNGYGFDQDFDVLSFGDPSDGNGCGWWGCGTSTKQLSGSEYQLVGTGEPHGTIRFTGTFDSVTWRSLSNENWNGFTVGVQGTAEQVFPCEVNPGLPECNGSPNGVPLPGTIALFGLGLAGLGFARRKKG